MSGPHTGAQYPGQPWQQPTGQGAAAPGQHGPQQAGPHGPQPGQPLRRPQQPPFGQPPQARPGQQTPQFAQHHPGQPGQPRASAPGGHAPKKGMSKGVMAALISAIVVIVGAVTTVGVMAGTGAFTAKPKPQPTVEPTVTAATADPDPTADPTTDPGGEKVSLRDSMDLGWSAELAVSNDSDWKERGGEYTTADKCWLVLQDSRVGMPGEDDQELTAFLWERVVTQANLESIREQDPIWVPGSDGKLIEMRAFIVESEGESMYFAIRADSESGIAYQLTAGGCSDLEALSEEIPQNVVFDD